MRRTIDYLALALMAAVLAGCSGSGSSGGRVAAKTGLETREVHAARATQGALPHTVQITGTLAAEEEAMVGLKVAGRVNEILVDLGSRVTQGQPMVRLATDDFILRVQQAEAAFQQTRARLGLDPNGTSDRVTLEETALVRQAQAVLEESRLRRERAELLWKEQLLPKSDFDAAVASYQVAEARYQDAIEEVRNRQALLAQRRSELELARQQLADTTLAAPFDGAVRERQVAIGQFMAAGQPVITLVRTHPLRLRVAVPEREAAALRVGQEVHVTVEGDTKAYPGRVARLSPAIDEASRTLNIEAEVPNQQGALRPGSFARAEIRTSGDLPVIFVPLAALVDFAGIEKVFVVQDGKAIEKRVRSGRRSGGNVEILDGVAVGDQVVLDPGTLVSGQPVTLLR